MTNNFREIRFFAGAQKSKILLGHALSEHFRIFFRPCRGPLAARSRHPYGRDMTCRAVLPKSNSPTGAIGPVHCKNRFYSRRVFKREFLEIGEFVSSNNIFYMFFSHVAFDWRCQFAKQMRNAGAWYGQAFGHVTIFFENIDFFAGAQTSKIFLNMLSPSTSVYFPGPAGSSSLRARVPLYDS